MSEYIPEEVQAVEVLGSDVYPSRHKPRKVLCRFCDGTVHPCSVKFAWNPKAAAACISELTTTQTLRHVRHVKTLESVIVRSSDSIYEAATGSYPDPIDNIGLHFGTVWRDDVDNGPAFVSDRVDFGSLFTLYVYDVWLRNLDRRTTGNTLLFPFAGATAVIASDNSDCFGGCETFIRGAEAITRASSSAEVALQREDGGAVPWNEFLNGIQIPWRILRAQAIDDCRAMVPAIEPSLRLCPPAWSKAAGFDPSFLTSLQHSRARDLPKLLENLDVFSPDASATRGGIPLDPPDGGK